MTAHPFFASETTNAPVGIDARLRRVLELRALVREGRYRRDDAEIAAAILADRSVRDGEAASAEPDPHDLRRFIVRPTRTQPVPPELAIPRSA
jgi:hypothetical protein